MTSVNSGLQVDWARRAFTDDTPSKPKMPKPEVPVRDPVVGAELGYRLPVTPTYAPLASRPLALQLHPKAEPTMTLSVADGARSRSSRRAELWRRQRDFVGHVSAACVAPSRLVEVQSSAQGYSLSLRPDLLEAVAPDGRFLQVKLPSESSGGPVELRPAHLELLLEVFEALLLGPAWRAPDVQTDAVRSAFAYLLGPGGLLNPQCAPPIEDTRRFSTPKLVCWDFNGTVERERNAGFRPDVGLITEALNTMGATSVITTSVDPRKVEKAMTQAGLHFNAYFGGPEVRPERGKKQYRGVAAAYALDSESAPHHMVSIGDSATDMSGDLEGVVFINSDSDTPAQWVHALLWELDKAGDGSFAHGLQNSLQRPLNETPQSLVLGDIAFDVALEPEGDQPGRCPKITNLRLAINTDAMREALQAGDTIKKQGVLRHVENQMPAADLVSFVSSMAGKKGEGEVLASMARRADRRLDEVEIAHATAAGLLSWLEGDPSAGEVTKAIEFVARSGDRAASAKLRKELTGYPVMTERRAIEARSDLVNSAKRIYASLGKLTSLTPSVGLSPGRDRKTVETLFDCLDAWPKQADKLEQALAELTVRGCSASLHFVVVELQQLWPNLVSEALEKHEAHFEARRELKPDIHMKPALDAIKAAETVWPEVFAVLDARQDELRPAAV